MRTNVVYKTQVLEANFHFKFIQISFLDVKTIIFNVDVALCCKNVNKGKFGNYLCFLNLICD